MKLYLMRHGDYLTEDVRHNNPLSKKGYKDIEHIASFLKSAAISVSHLLHSEKLRAKQTADILSTGLICDKAPQEWRGINPLDDVSAFIESIADWEEDVFVVGHLPFMGRLLGLLVAHDENKELIAFQPGTLVCLEKIETGRWIIQWAINPELFESKTP